MPFQLLQLELALFNPHLIEIPVSCNCIFLQQEWTTKVLTHNLSTNVLGQTRFGLITPIVFYQLTTSSRKGPDVVDKTSKNMKQAHTLGWCVELNRASEVTTR